MGIGPIDRFKLARKKKTMIILWDALPNWRYLSVTLFHIQDAGLEWSGTISIKSWTLLVIVQLLVIQFPLLVNIPAAPLVRNGTKPHSRASGRRVISASR
jgi:hypothetical protein